MQFVQKMLSRCVGCISAREPASVCACVHECVVCMSMCVCVRACVHMCMHSVSACVCVHVFVRACACRVYARARSCEHCKHFWVSVEFLLN